MNKAIKDQGTVEAANDRREFLKTAGKFGITAPMAAMLLSVKSKKAMAVQPYAKGNNGFGNGGGDGTPNGFPDENR